MPISLRVKLDMILIILFGKSGWRSTSLKKCTNGLWTITTVHTVVNGKTYRLSTGVLNNKHKG